MAAEAPYLSHTQLIAAANYSSTASLSGPNGAGQFLLMKCTTGGKATLCAANADVPIGILQNDPVSGAAANIAFAGVSKVVVGASVSAGAALMSDTSGRAITQTGTNPVIGYALDAATAANQLIRCQIALQVAG